MIGLKDYIIVTVVLAVFGGGFYLGRQSNTAKVVALEGKIALWQRTYSQQESNIAEYQAAIKECSDATAKLEQDRAMYSSQLQEAGRVNDEARQRVQVLSAALAAKPLPADPTAAAREGARRLAELARAVAP